MACLPTSDRPRAICRVVLLRSMPNRCFFRVQDAGPGVVASGGRGRSLQIGFTGVGGPITSVVINGVTGTDLTGAAVKTGQAIDYSFLNASTILNGTPETITGRFTFDSLTEIEYFAIIRLTGAGPYAGEYDYDTNKEVPLTSSTHLACSSPLPTICHHPALIPS